MKRTLGLFLTLVLPLAVSGCDLVGDVIEAGFWMVVIFGLFFFALAWAGMRWVARRGRRDRPPPP